VNLSSEQAAKSRMLAAGRHVTADVALRARIVLWAGEGRRRKDIAELAGVAARTVDRTKTRYSEHGLAGLVEKKRGGGKETRRRERPGTAADPRPGNRADQDEPAAGIGPLPLVDPHAGRSSGTARGHQDLLPPCRLHLGEENLKPHRSGTFTLSKGPAFAEKVADIVGLYLDPPGGAVVLSVDEKTQVQAQALDRTQPALLVAFAAIEKRTHDHVRHGTTNLSAALRSSRQRDGCGA